MRYDEVIAEIITKTDEAFIGVSEARARQHFRGAVSSLIIEGAFADDDLLLMKSSSAVTVGAAPIDITAIDTRGILRIIDIIIPPDSTTEVILSRATLDEVKRWAYNYQLRPNWNTVKWYQIGELVYIEPANRLITEDIWFIYIVPPPIYDPLDMTGDLWRDDTDMLTWFSYAFLLAAIERASAFLAREVN